MATISEKIKFLPKMDKNKAVAAVGLLGGIILLIYGLNASQISYYNGIDESLIFRYINAIVTIGWASLALCSSVLLLKGKDIGFIILLIAAIGGIVGSFIPIFSYYPYGYDPYSQYNYLSTIYLNGTGGYFDLVLMLVGGILGVSLAEKKERRE